MNIGKWARRALLSHGNLLKLDFAVMILCTASILPFLITRFVLFMFPFEIDDSGMIVSSTEVYIMASFAIIAEFILIILPLLHGIYLLAREAAHGNASMKTLLSPFSSGGKNFGLAISSGFMILVRILLTVMPFIGGLTLIGGFLADIVDLSSFAVVCVVMFVLFASFAACFASVFLCSGIYFVPYCRVRGDRLIESFSDSIAAAKGQKMRILSFAFGFSGLLVLSLLTFGVALAIYTIPYMLVSYFIFADECTADQY